MGEKGGSGAEEVGWVAAALRAGVGEAGCSCAARAGSGDTGTGGVKAVAAVEERWPRKTEGASSDLRRERRCERAR